MGKYDKELSYIEKKLKKAKASYKKTDKIKDPTAAENLKEQIEILENIKDALGGNKVVENCPVCSRMYYVDNPHKHKLDV